MSKANNQTILPFSLEELTTKEDWELPIYPQKQHWLAAMRDKEKEMKREGKLAVEKLMTSLVELKPNVYGFRLPRKSCVFVDEAELIKQLAANRNQAYLEYARIGRKLEQELSISNKEVMELLKAPLMHLDLLDPWIEEIMQVMTGLQATNTTTATITVMLQQRLLPTWSADDTPFLPEAMFDELFNYYLGEQSGWKSVDIQEITSDQKSVSGKKATKTLAASAS